MRKHADSPRGGEQSEQHGHLQNIFSIRQENIYLYGRSNIILSLIETNGSKSGHLCYLPQLVSHRIKGVKRERDGWTKGKMESSWVTGVCPNSDSPLAERGGKDAQLRAQSFPACSVPYIDRLAEIKENMNRDLDFFVIQYGSHRAAVIRFLVLLRSVVTDASLTVNPCPIATKTV